MAHCGVDVRVYVPDPVYGADQVGAVADWIETLRDTTQKGIPAVSTLRDTLKGVARMLDPLL